MKKKNPQDAPSVLSYLLIYPVVWLTVGTPLDFTTSFLHSSQFSAFHCMICSQCHFLVGLFVCLLVGCLTSQQQASVSQGRICSDNFACCHTEREIADQTFYLTQSQYTDTGPISPSADPITPGTWQSSLLSANF